MLSINTNLSSLITQSSMNSAINKLNQAIERMTTGTKINHAKDNAAGYSIATNMTTKLYAYDVAAGNVAMGMDLVTTASDTLSLMQDKAERLRTLCIQARNNTYGAQSLAAINTEANAITDEIERLFKTAEYNGIKLFDNSQEQTNMPEAGVDGFIKTVEKQDTSPYKKLSTVSSSSDLADGTYSISTANELAQLAQMTNDGFISEGDTFILANDIDLAQYCADKAGEGGWTPIGNDTFRFLGTFDGNGYKIQNLEINRSGIMCQGLFGRIDGNSVIKNLGVTDVDITSDVNCTGAIVGAVKIDSKTLIDNCYSTGIINGAGYSGGLAGQSGNVTNCYSNCSVIASGNNVGALVGFVLDDSTFNNCYATGSVTGSGNSNGGLIGLTKPNATITNCYATGDVTSSDINCGGLVGLLQANATITNCYATGDVTSTDIDYSQIGGLIGVFKGGTISNCYATGNVTGEARYVGGLVGCLSTSTALIENCYATGCVAGNQGVGGLIGMNDDASTLTITSSYCTGNVTGIKQVGGFLGVADIDSTVVFENCYTKSSLTSGAGAKYNSGFLGLTCANTNVTMKNCSVLGELESNAEAVFTSKINTGTLTIENCRYNSELIESTFPLVADRDGVDVTDDTIRANVSTCGFITPFEFTASFGFIVPIEYFSPVKFGDDINISLQVGIDSSLNSQITLKTNFSLDYLNLVRQIGNADHDLLKSIDTMLNTITTKQTEFGAVQNRLESALESITVNIENLTSSLSTIRDADIAQESSRYIQAQILQQASATLLATANQSPSIALQLI